MCAFDFFDAVDDMEGMDFLKIAGGAVAGVGAIAALPIFGAIGTITASGAILGSILGAGAGMAVVSEDEDERRSIRRGIEHDKEQEWQDSALARQGLVAASSSMDGYHKALKLIYSLAASAASQEDTSDLSDVREQLDEVFAVWLPQNLKDELQLLFQNPPTFFDVGLMIREGLASKDLNGNEFIDSAEFILDFLDGKGVLEFQSIKKEWDAFKVGLITNTQADGNEKKAEEDESKSLAKKVK